MTGGLDRASRAIIVDALGGSSPFLAFAEAVVAHLSSSPAGVGSPTVVACRVTRILHAVLDPAGGPAAEMLLAEPAVLASFFQNSDLLDPEAPGMAEVASAIMEAVGRAGER